ncbi:putative methionyl-tRNA synthetase [Hordeum vulgare]|nr:putative methionyl-tRNA synthetase [Hordeum vulgare]
MSKEDECLTEAWKTVSIDLITDANHNTDTYWERIKTMFDKRKLVDPDFANMHMDCDDNGEPLGNDPNGLQQVAWDR